MLETNIARHDSVVWSPYTVKDIDAVESVQRRFTKRLLGYNFWHTTSEMHEPVKP